ncbi:unnamed protein product (plasmid) [Mycetohabitans rhizoxinica HKI 454]|uniref:Uncharacterized protein n=1 Tax=Mycetohabitans rhizoxinica (strain DSM 19002 / CIP 109453 / HKI 454) TaxID=882378 RepID=E5AWC5_MYCRK|nr:MULTISPECIES: hypothetical protein [Mycetohabitans]MCG1048660.1 hypothetical protein [Mycetohabitans sp. B6]CBW77427.1 unnamed protein product [Mycetohabitans rhizoxinica HKI 454]
MLPIVLALAQFAPQIAQWIGGSRAEQVAQKVVTIAQTVTGTSTPEQALAAIQANPELAYRFQESIVESQVELQRIAAELEKAHITANIETAKVNAADRANARQMALTVEDRTPRNLAYLYTGALFLVIGAHFWLLFSRITVEPLAFGVLGNIEGVLISMVLGAKEFFLGSSSTAKKQAAVITSFATDPDTYATTQALNPMVTRTGATLPSLAEGKP